MCKTKLMIYRLPFVVHCCGDQIRRVRRVRTWWQKEMLVEFWWENLARNILEGLYLIRRIILKWVLNKIICYGLGSCGWEQGQLAECCGCSNELS